MSPIRLIHYFLNVHQKGGLPDLIHALKGQLKVKKISYFKVTLKIKEYMLNSKCHL